jgi:hypothetical protein
VAPTGTVTVKLVVVAAVAVARVAPKTTILLARTVLKFVPVMVTEVPTAPEVGENEVMVGGQLLTVTLTALEAAELYAPLTFTQVYDPVMVAE